MTSREGFHWTPKDGLKAGLPSISVIKPQEKILPANEIFSDVIVIGAGYTGLVAARDLTTQGVSLCRAPSVRVWNRDIAFKVIGWDQVFQLTHEIFYSKLL